jgi:hypothetical protein
VPERGEQVDHEVEVLGLVLHHEHPRHLSPPAVRW